jgi:hypothetical protein
MRLVIGRNGRVAAATTFYGLVLLAFGLLLALSGFVSYFIPIYDACASLWDNLRVWMSSPGVLLPIAVVGSVVGMTGLALLRQWHATRRLLRSLAPYRVPTPPRLARIARDLGFEGRIDTVSDILTAPFCYGFIRPRVCVPTTLLDMLDDAELRAVLRHEGYHAENRDPLKVWLSRALARGLYFLPLAGDLRDSYLAAKEIAADETTADSDELPLASALVKLLSAREGVLPVLRPGAAGSGVVGGFSVARLISVTREPANGTEERIRRLVDGQQVEIRLPSITNVLLSVAIVVAIFATSYVNLNAASMIPASQECAAENEFRQPESTLVRSFETQDAALRQAPRQALRQAQDVAWSIERPGVWPESNAGSVVQSVAGPGATMNQPSCDLLIPRCP